MNNHKTQHLAPSMSQPNRGPKATFAHQLKNFLHLQPHESLQINVKGSVVIITANSPRAIAKLNNLYATFFNNGQQIPASLNNNGIMINSKQLQILCNTINSSSPVPNILAPALNAPPISMPLASPTMSSPTSVHAPLGYKADIAAKLKGQLGLNASEKLDIDIKNNQITITAHSSMAATRLQNFRTQICNQSGCPTFPNSNSNSITIDPQQKKIFFSTIGFSAPVSNIPAPALNAPPISMPLAPPTMSSPTSVYAPLGYTASIAAQLKGQLGLNASEKLDIDIKNNQITITAHSSMAATRLQNFRTQICNQSGCPTFPNSNSNSITIVPQQLKTFFNTIGSAPVSDKPELNNNQETNYSEMENFYNCLAPRMYP